MAEYIAGHEASAFYAQQEAREAQANLSFADGSAEEAARQESAQDLANRHNNSSDIGGATDYAGEQQLLQLQRELAIASDSGNFIRMEALEAQVNELAQKLISGNSVPNTSMAQSHTEEEPFEEENAAEQLRSQYGDQSVDETLQWASTAFSEDVSAELNDLMGSSNEDTYTAFEGLRQLQQNPDLINRGDVGAFDIGIANELAESYGQAGTDLAAINAALSAGKCTRAEAARLVMGNSQLAAVALQAAQSGLINLAL